MSSEFELETDLQLAKIGSLKNCIERWYKLESESLVGIIEIISAAALVLLARTLQTNHPKTNQYECTNVVQNQPEVWWSADIGIPAKFMTGIICGWKLPSSTL